MAAKWLSRTSSEKKRPHGALFYAQKQVYRGCDFFWAGLLFQASPLFCFILVYCGFITVGFHTQLHFQGHMYEVYIMG
jgi:hypothetical protein